MKSVSMENIEKKTGYQADRPLGRVVRVFILLTLLSGAVLIAMDWKSFAAVLSRAEAKPLLVAVGLTIVSYLCTSAAFAVTAQLLGIRMSFRALTDGLCLHCFESCPDYWRSGRLLPALYSYTPAGRRGQGYPGCLHPAYLLLHRDIEGIFQRFDGTMTCGVGAMHRHRVTVIQFMGLTWIDWSSHRRNRCRRTA